MLQSFFSDKLSRFNPVVPGLIAAAVVVAIYCTSNSEPIVDDDEEQDGKVVMKRVRYLPSKIPVLGNAIELLRNSERMYDWISDQIVPFDGEPFTLSLPGKDDMIFIAKPEHIEQVLKTQFDNFPKSQHIHDVFFDLLGDGIVTTNGETWKRQRRVLVNLFSARALREHMTPISQKYVVKLRKIFEDAVTSKEPMDAFGLMHRYTLDVFAEIGFGTEMKLLEGSYEPFAEAIEESQYIVSARFKQPDALWKIMRWLNIGSEKKLRHAVQVIDEHVMGIVSGAIQRRQERHEAIKAGKEVKAADKDIVSIILDSMESNNQVVDPVEVRNIAAAALIAGRDTTADALGWLFHMLSENPNVEGKLRSELLKHLPKLATDVEYVPTVEEISEVHYLEATIRELLRILPAGPLIATHCVRDTVFPDGTFVPKNTDIGIAFYTTGRLTGVWGEDALEFKPERFLDTETGEVIKVSSSKFCAFSAGPRICVGRNLAFLEMKIVIANIVSRFHLVPEPGQQKPAYSQGITLGMQTPLMMRVEPIALQGPSVAAIAKATGTSESTRSGAVAALKMLQSMFKSPVVPGLVTAAVLVTLYWAKATKVSAKIKGDKVKHAVILPGTLPVLGNAVELAANAPRMHDWLADQFAATDGDAFIVRLPGKDDMMFIAKPEHLEAVLKTQFDIFPKSEYIHDVFCDMLGDGIVVTNGETWKRQRNVVVGLFSARALRDHMTPLVQKYTVQLVDILADAAAKNIPLDVFDLLHRYTFDVFGEIGFGAKMGSMDGAFQPFAEAMDEAQFLAGKRFKQPMWYWKLRRWLNVGDEKKLKESVRVIDEHLMGIIADAIERRRLRVEEKKAGRPAALADKDIVSIVLDNM
ncbi:Cytochrome p450, partial [Phytophthora palmivora]